MDAPAPVRPQWAAGDMAKSAAPRAIALVSLSVRAWYQHIAINNNRVPAVEHMAADELRLLRLMRRRKMRPAARGREGGVGGGLITNSSRCLVEVPRRTHAQSAAGSVGCS